MPTPLIDIAWILLIFLVFPFPVGTDRRVRTFPWVTWSIVIVTVACFLLTRHSLDDIGSSSPFDEYGLTPRFPHAFQFVSYLFIHQNVSHLLWNLGFLWLFGPSVEDAIGPWFYAGLYFGGGIAAGLLNTAIVMLFASNTPVSYVPLIGASGAIAAILGVFAVRFHRSAIRIYWLPAAVLDQRGGVWEAPALVGLALWLAQNLFGAISSLIDPSRAGIAYWAHIGGFVFGVAIAQLTDLLGDGKSEYLLREASACAASGGAIGKLDAIAKYRLALQRRPDDKAARQALADFAERSQNESIVREKLAAEYGCLIDYCLTHDAPEVASRWIDEAKRHEIAPIFTAKSLTLWAEYQAQRGNLEIAAGMYQRLIAEHPATRDAQLAHLELASLELNRLGRTTEATGVLRDFLRRESDKLAG